ncbi:MAG: four helix bundle protein [Bacteroidota bacterium]|nr:four helix bundle protein [Bacteroidota bacterium]
MFLELSHTHLDIFSASRELTVCLYKSTRSFPPEEKYALTQQIRRAAVSVHLNIAEGFSRKSKTERKRFSKISRGSLIEIDTALDIAIELGYIHQEYLTQEKKNMTRCFQMLSKMITSLKTHD